MVMQIKMSVCSPAIPNVVLHSHRCVALNAIYPTSRSGVLDILVHRWPILQYRVRERFRDEPGMTVFPFGKV